MIHRPLYHRPYKTVPSVDVIFASLHPNTKLKLARANPHLKPPATKRKMAILKSTPVMTPLLLTLIPFFLIVGLIQIGTSPTTFSNYPILSLNTTGLKQNYSTAAQPTLPIHDVYNLYLRTHCDGYFWNETTEVVGLECSKPAGYGKINPPRSTPRF